MGACTGKAGALSPGRWPGKDHLVDKDRRRLSVNKVDRPSGLSDCQSSAGPGTVAACSVADILDLLPSTSQTGKASLRGVVVSASQSAFADKSTSSAGEGSILGPGSRIGYACKKGLKPESPNQDDFCIFCTDSSSIYGVFDGHGPYGHDVANFTQEHLPRILLHHPNFSTDPQKALEAAFPDVHRLCIDSQVEGHFDCTLSGSTATVLLHRDGVLHIAHVGDSRAVLARQREGGEVVAEDLTEDHKPTVEAERKRVQAAGGQVRRLEGDIPYRVFLQGKMYPGLSMTRSIGDTMGIIAGITSQPEVKTIPVEEDWCFVLVCSDGIWEFITSQEAVALVAGFPAAQAHAAAEALASEAWRRWIAEEGNVVDDITVVVAWIGSTPPSKEVHGGDATTAAK